MRVFNSTQKILTIIFATFIGAMTIFPPYKSLAFYGGHQFVAASGYGLIFKLPTLADAVGRVVDVASIIDATTLLVQMFVACVIWGLMMAVTNDGGSGSEIDKKSTLWKAMRAFVKKMSFSDNSKCEKPKNVEKKFQTRRMKPSPVEKGSFRPGPVPTPPVIYL